MTSYRYDKIVLRTASNSCVIIVLYLFLMTLIQYKKKQDMNYEKQSKMKQSFFTIVIATSFILNDQNPIKKTREFAYTPGNASNKQFQMLALQYCQSFVILVMFSFKFIFKPTNK